MNAIMGGIRELWLEIRESHELALQASSECHANASRRQRGFVLLTALVLLLVLTLAALVAMVYQANQARVAGNTANAQISFETAEGALRIAEGQLLTGAYTGVPFTTAGNNGLYLFNPLQAPLWTNPSTWSGSGTTFASTFSGLSSAAPQVMIEQLPSVAMPGQSLASVQYGGGVQTVNVYRITVRAVGANGKAPVMVQSIFHE